ncbi:MAG: hypothetical protein HY220_04190 [Candidatus Sungbacteria bacterium]|uniref:Uncharacterized protein n=1 Tax=Candidatus Sungiibacteriota bacterium TaxID=2750080 RepID=A0A9D6QSD8_9BACT|nr:hypothetical protein [Candidatus Sungbacteria bacterium]
MKYWAVVEFEAQGDNVARAIAQDMGNVVRVERIVKESYGDSLDGPGFGHRHVETAPISLS